LDLVSGWSRRSLRKMVHARGAMRRRKRSSVPALTGEDHHLYTFQGVTLKIRWIKSCLKRWSPSKTTQQRINMTCQYGPSLISHQSGLPEPFGSSLTIWQSKTVLVEEGGRKRRRRSLLRIARARGAIPNEMGPTRRRRSLLPAVTGEATTTRWRKR
jgi:hypothetical protein